VKENWPLVICKTTSKETRLGFLFLAPKKYQLFFIYLNALMIIDYLTEVAIVTNIL